MQPPWYTDDAVQVWHGDCLDVLADIADNTVDAVVTDPPAGISFMGRTWDGNKGGRDAWIGWLAKVLAECLRVAKPGAHAYVWALPRTSGWTHRAIEDAGWEVRDCTTHLFGSGFPKSLNLGDGRGTALKPASEHWYLARKPIRGTVAANVLAWGTGALNIDAARVGTDVDTRRSKGHNPSAPSAFPHSDDAWVPHVTEAGSEMGGRWPPNVALDQATADQLDRESGWQRTGVTGPGAGGFRREYVNGQPTGRSFPQPAFEDGGGASRYFPVFRYEPKAPTHERPRADGTPDASAIGRRRCARCGKQAVNVRPSSQCQCDEPEWVLAESSQATAHPTVKPLDLMRWLVRLVTPPNGVVLDPFLGSGTTAEACIVEGFRCWGVEREDAYLPMIRARLTKPIQPVLDLGGPT